MRRLLVLSLLLGGLVAALVVSGQTPPVKMAWQMGSGTFQFREAHLIAYPVAASDFVVPLRCAYLGDLDTYIWQFKADVPAKYATGDWILAGYAHGYVVAQRFQIKAGATLSLAPVAWNPPTPASHTAGQALTVNYQAPALGDAVDHWEVLQDGTPLAVDAHGQGVGGTLDRVRTTGLRAVLVGGPLTHYLVGPSLEIAPDLGDHT